MLKIGKSHIVHTDGKSRLCADFANGNFRTSMLFGVKSPQEECLCLGRADPFIVALLPAAMWSGRENVCEDAASEKLYGQSCGYLIPSLAFVGGVIHTFYIRALFTLVKHLNEGAVSIGLSGGVESIYAIMHYQEDCEYPLTHLVLFDIGWLLLAHGQENREIISHTANLFTREHGLKPISLRTNLEKMLSNGEPRYEVFPFAILLTFYLYRDLFQSNCFQTGLTSQNLRLTFTLLAIMTHYLFFVLLRKA